MKEGPGTFNLAASARYKKLDYGDRSRLKESCVGDEIQMNERAIKKEGAKIFRKVQSQVCITIIIGNLLLSAICRPPSVRIQIKDLLL